MQIGRILRELREQAGLTQADIQRSSGFFRSFISRVECGHTIPCVETLERWTRALNVRMYQIFYEGHDNPATPPIQLTSVKSERGLWGISSKESAQLYKLRGWLASMSDSERKYLLSAATKLVQVRARSKHNDRAGNKKFSSDRRRRKALLPQIQRTRTQRWSGRPSSIARFNHRSD